ncbi:hypothetical protein C0557_20935 [Kosakonia sp. MUSA4]|nr:hypothetical protein C0557_20935 [Kosakonia sp. MUSA4]
MQAVDVQVEAEKGKLRGVTREKSAFAVACTAVANSAEKPFFDEKKPAHYCTGCVMFSQVRQRPAL